MALENNTETILHEIVKKVQSGKEESFQELISMYQNIIYSIGMRFFRNEDDSFDFCQEVFLKAYDKIDSYSFRGSFHYWLLKLAYNLAINKENQSKKKTTHSLPELAEIESNYDSPESSFDKDEIRQILLKEINNLPEKYRICLDFYFFCGLDYKQIHSITGISVNTIKSNVFRAKQILHQKLLGTIAEDYHEM